MSLREFVPASFPLPQNPVHLSAIYDGMGDFVAGGFPLPQGPIAYIASAEGSLPKVPDLTTADLAPIPSYDSQGMGCGCGGSCGGCGMGAVDTIFPQASLPSFLQGDALISGFPTVYLAAAAIVGVLVFMNSGAARGRRR